MKLKLKSKDCNFPDRLVSQDTRLLDVWVFQNENISEYFKEFDRNELSGRYTVLFNNVMLLILETENKVWSVFSRWTPEKESKMRKHIGDEVILDIRSY